jgi:hypothetical protein
MGRSESAIMTSAEQTRFRVDYPNSRPRVSRIIALDDRSLSALMALKDRPWNGARFLRYLRAEAVSKHLPTLAVDALLEDAEGRRTSLREEVAEADVIVMVATAGGAAQEAAEIIGNTCSVLGKLATGLVLKIAEDEDLAVTLRAMRPYAAMLVVSNAEDYIGDMLMALRA